MLTYSTISARSFWIVSQVFLSRELPIAGALAAGGRRLQWARFGRVLSSGLAVSFAICQEQGTACDLRTGKASVRQQWLARSRT